jgi:hypothetical protein
MFTKKTTLQTLSILSASVFLVVGFANTILPVKAVGNGSLSISPTTSEYRADEPLTKGWIIEKLNPGDQVTRKVLVSNTTDEDKTVMLSEEDYYPGDEGGYSYTDKETLKDVGTWLKLDSHQVTLPPQKSTEVNFTITVPTDTKPGEYSGVIALQEVTQDTSTNAINFVSRVSTRIYITVPGNLQTGVKFDNFKFVTPDPSYTDPVAYQQFLKANYNLSADNIFLDLNYTNIGNVFNKLRGNIQVTDPDGKVTTNAFSRDLGYGDPISVPYYMLDAKWTKPGTYTAVYNFTNDPLIASNKDNLKNISPTQTVQTSFTITQAQIDQLNSDLAKSKVSVNNPAGNPDNSKTGTGLTVNSTSTPSTDSSSNNSSTPSSNNSITVQDALWVGFTGFIIAIIVLVIGYLIYKDLKKKKTVESANSKESTIQGEEDTKGDYAENIEPTESNKSVEPSKKSEVIIKPKKVVKSDKSTKSDDTSKAKKSK